MTQPADDSPNPLPTALAVVLAVAAVVAAVAFLGFRDDDGDAAPGTVAATATPSATATGDAPVTAPPADGAPVAETRVGSCTYRSDGAAARDVTPPTEADLRTGSVTATMQTTAGAVTLRLDGAAAPCATASFVSLARQGYYDDTPCHRILDGAPGEGSIAQCGDPTGTGTGGPGYVYDEENLSAATYGRGTLAMAKTQAPGSTGAQFFLVTRDFPLPPEYTVVGAITGGLEALDTVIEAGTTDGAVDGAPKTPLKLVTVTTSG